MLDAHFFESVQSRTYPGEELFRPFLFMPFGVHSIEGERGFR